MSRAALELDKARFEIAALKAENERLERERDKWEQRACTGDDVLARTRDKLSAAERALAERAGGVKVNPLEWNHGYASVMFGGGYLVTYYAGMKEPAKLETRGWWDGEPNGHFKTIEAAKSAAQADYERRILSALTTEPGAPATKVWQLPTVDKTLAEMLVIATGGGDDEGADDEWLPEQRARVDLWQASIRDALSAAPEERQSSERTCATCHAVLADGPQPFATYAPDTRPAEQAVTSFMRNCATDRCDKKASVHFERGGVGSDYCHDCYMRVQALAQEKGR